MKFSCCAIRRSMIGDRRAGAEHELLGLAHVDQRRDTAALAHLRQLQRLLTRRQRPARDIELQVERAQLEVAVGNLADDGRQHRAPPPSRGEQLRACRFGGAPEAAPEVQLPGRAALESQGRRVARCRRSLRGCASAAGLHVRAHARILIRPRDPELGLRLRAHAPRRAARCRCASSRGAHERLELFVLEHLPPLRLAECGTSGRCPPRRESLPASAAPASSSSARPGMPCAEQTGRRYRRQSRDAIS